MTTQDGQRGGPLEGVRVVELTKVWAGPETGKQLAFLGAEVIKIETLSSLDITRVYGGTTEIDKATGFMAVNPQKMSVQIDIKKKEGAALLRDLLKHTDIFVENLRPGAIARAGLDYDIVKNNNEDIIYVSMGMCGSNGPLAYQTGYAPCFNALSGLSSLIGYEGEPPAGMNVRYADSTFGTAAAYAAIVALIHRRKTGKGQFIDVSAVEAMTSMIGDTVMDFSLNGNIATCEGSKHPEMAPHNVYRCKGGDWVAIAASDDDAWSAIADALGQPELATDSRFATLAARKANEADLDRIISDWTATVELADLVADLQGRGVAAGKSQNSIDLVADSQFWQRGFHREVTEWDGNVKPIIGPAWTMTRGAVISDGAPKLGQHNSYVLGEILGLSDAEQQELAAAGITR